MNEYKLTRFCDNKDGKLSWKLEKTNGEQFNHRDLVYFDRAWVENQASKLKVGESIILNGNI